MQASLNGEFLGYILTLRPVSGPGAGDRTSIEVRDESFKTQVRHNGHNSNLWKSSNRNHSQNYSLNGLLRHTNYIVTVAAKNLEGLGPEASIQLRTEDGGAGQIQSRVRGRG